MIAAVALPRSTPSASASPNQSREHHEDATRLSSSPTSPVDAVSLEDRWAALVDLQRQYILGPGAIDILCLSLAVALCALRATRDDMSVWLFLIGNPSSGKSATVQLLRNHSALVYRDEITAKALSSGSRDVKGNKVPSLLDELDMKCLVMPDMATFFEQHEVTVRAILGTMTSAFDGTYNKATGTVGSLSHVAHFGWLGVTTPSHHTQYEGFMRKLGPRVLAFRVPTLSAKEERQVRTLTRRGGRRSLHQQLAQDVVTHLSVLQQAQEPTVPDAIEKTLEDVDEMLLRGRALIEGEEIQKEGPGRAYQQLRALMLAVASVRGHAEVSWDDLALIRQVVLSSMPKNRAQALQYLAAHPTTTAAQLSAWIGKSSDTARGTLDTLVLLSLASKQAAGQGLAAGYVADAIIAQAFRAG